MTRAFCCRCGLEAQAAMLPALLPIGGDTHPTTTQPMNASPGRRPAADFLLRDMRAVKDPMLSCSFKLPSWMLDAIQREAVARGVHVPTVVRNLLAAGLEQLEAGGQQ